MVSVKFNNADIGRLVVLSLDPESEPVAKRLGADEVKVQGEILSVTDEYVEIETRPWCSGPVPRVSRKYMAKQVPYSSIISYEFIPYVKNTSKRMQKVIKKVINKKKE